LYPYGPGVNLINHGSGTKANVKVQWSDHYMSHHTWLSLPSDQFWQMNYPGAILFDFVAIRDIEAGEELFLDYGTVWEDAWNAHVSSWKKPSSSMGKYVYVEEVDRTKPYRTVKEQKKEPYAANLHSVCYTPNWRRDEYTVMEWYQPNFDFPEGLVYCNIVERKLNKKTKQYEYKVSLNFHEMEPDHEDREKYIDTHVPHSAISFVDKPYMSDLHLKNAFRHPIGLPKSLQPSQWQTKLKG
jgi:hypothetical protein